MLKVTLTESLVNEADKLAKDMGRIRNSITKGEGNVAGFIGEIVCAKLFNAERKGTKDYDLVLPDGKTVDVKTKRTTVKPLLHYDCSVAKLSLHQKCDAYAFCRVKTDLSVCWFLGLVDHDQYFKNARFLTKGELDPSNNFTVKSDCYNVSIEKLKELQSTHEYLRREVIRNEKGTTPTSS